MKNVIITRRIVIDIYYFDQNRSGIHNQYTHHSDDDHSFTKLFSVIIVYRNLSYPLISSDFSGAIFVFIISITINFR